MSMLRSLRTHSSFIRPFRRALSRSRFHDSTEGFSAEDACGNGTAQPCPEVPDRKRRHGESTS